MRLILDPNTEVKLRIIIIVGVVGAEFCTLRCVLTVVDEKPALSDLQYMRIADKDGETHFRLMERLQPLWRHLAIALKFPQHKIKTMEHNDDSVFDLLNEWLHGANMEEDMRPVTWGTLIEALREANYHEEADILKKCLVLTERGASVPVASQSGKHPGVDKPEGTAHTQSILKLLLFITIHLLIF